MKIDFTYRESHKKIPYVRGTILIQQNKCFNCDNQIIHGDFGNLRDLRLYIEENFFKHTYNCEFFLNGKHRFLKYNYNFVLFCDSCETYKPRIYKILGEDDFEKILLMRKFWEYNMTHHNFTRYPQRYRNVINHLLFSYKLMLEKIDSHYSDSDWKPLNNLNTTYDVTKQIGLKTLIHNKFYYIPNVPDYIYNLEKLYLNSEISPYENIRVSKPFVYNNLIEIQENKCIYCNKEMIDKHNHKLSPSIEHLIPACIIKSDLKENLMVACQSCNSKKSNFLPSQFIDENSQVDNIIKQIKTIDVNALQNIIIRRTVNSYLKQELDDLNIIKEIIET